MPICELCGQEFSKPCSCVKHIRLIDGEPYERSTFHFDEPDGYCHDCKAPHGTYHHFGCDVERCPKCGHQLLSCGHLVDIEDIKKDIKEFFERNHGENIDYTDILEEFPNFSLPDVVEACEQLEKEEKIQEVNKSKEKFFGENIKEAFSGIKRIWKKFKK